ncbi:MAG: short chain isoprenyl diphosphate synthase IdsA [Methanobrevibacter sp.]|uniref:short chain isoprenyl diphosphate synthase IdsA n=1 Tax=Methanobrevibacter sp. TaxID=66852 RepID=UPI0026DFE92D|nr:short chain isoprenyl diphosphate synthase IdsA [Methanobrevibacter sp.]MDO5848743.1 short chain isoprenyl diphosphate synthase IdsA [Methanobrevibacter sp.]
MSDVKEILGSYSDDIINVIVEGLSDITPESLQEASIYLTKAGGKMLRPCLALISAEAIGGKKESAVYAAAAIELIHTFSLIHDDIMDEDDMRRGMPSVHKVWGNGVAILAGDTLFSKAFELICNSERENVSPLQITQTIATVSDACVKICEGQAADISFEGRYDVTEDEYLDMIFKKTGALICAATKAGAITGGASEDIVEIMYDYGRLIGLAFQIQDDYLDLVSDEESLGKPIGSDIVKGKMTLIVVNALENASEEDGETLLEILKNPNSTQEDVDIAIEIFNKYGSIEYARNIAQDNVDEAKQLLEILPDSPSKTALELIADFVLERHS